MREKKKCPDYNLREIDLAKKKAKGSRAKKAKACRQATKTEGFIPEDMAALDNTIIPAQLHCKTITAMYAFCFSIFC